MARTKTNTQNDTKHVKYHDATDILEKKTYFCVFFYIFFVSFFFFIISSMNSPRNGAKKRINMTFGISGFNYIFCVFTKFIQTLKTCVFFQIQLLTFLD